MEPVTRADVTERMKELGVTSSCGLHAIPPEVAMADLNEIELHMSAARPCPEFASAKEVTSEDVQRRMTELGVTEGAVDPETLKTIMSDLNVIDGNQPESAPEGEVTVAAVVKRLMEMNISTNPFARMEELKRLEGIL